MGEERIQTAGSYADCFTRDLWVIARWFGVKLLISDLWSKGDLQDIITVAVSDMIYHIEKIVQ